MEDSDLDWGVSRSRTPEARRRSELRMIGLQVYYRHGDFWRGMLGPELDVCQDPRQQEPEYAFSLHILGTSYSFGKPLEEIVAACSSSLFSADQPQAIALSFWECKLV